MKVCRNLKPRKVLEAKQKRESFAEFETVKSCRNEIETVKVLRNLKPKKIADTKHKREFFSELQTVKSCEN